MVCVKSVARRRFLQKGLVAVINNIYYADIQCLRNAEIKEQAIQLLCDERIEKIKKCRKEEDKLRGITAGLLLEYGLRERGLAQKKLHFITEKNGKPKILENPDLHFNLTHSGEYAAAVFADTEVGIDIEHFRENDGKTPERCFSKEEQRFLLAHKDASSFTRIWTRKESYVKATGHGLRMSFASFSTVEEQVRQKQQSECYYLQSCDRIPGYWLSVCTKGKKEDAFMEKIDLAAFFAE